MSEFSALRGERTAGWLAQTRSEVLARNGIVATSQPLAAQAGLQVLKQGGNAFDAAVATAAVLNVVEPASAGIGGDVFAIAWMAREQTLIALNASGRAASGATPARLAARGHTQRMPMHGIDAATVPGAVDGWDALLRRAGSMSLAQLLEPAIEVAERGFGVSERIAQDWSRGAHVLRNDAESDRSYLLDGRPPRKYELFRNPDLARTFKLLQAHGKEVFYQGEIAHSIVKCAAGLGGTMTLQDLTRTRATWESPLSTEYHGYEIHQMPPSTQGFAVLAMLNILEACERRLGVRLCELGPRAPLYWHLLVEAKKLAYTDLHAFNADPDFADVPVAKLISKAYAAELCTRINPDRASVPPSRADAVGGTVYLAAADRWGNMVSFIYSIYDSFGCGVTVPGCGFVLNNRAALFSLDLASPNVLAPHKRPFHTLLPGFVTRDGKPTMAFGLMGGSQQAQGHAQVLIDMIDLGANPQAASDAARFTHSQETNRLGLEASLFDLVGAPLRALGHEVEAASAEGMGGFESVSCHRLDGAADGVYSGASDHRKDGQAAGW